MNRIYYAKIDPLYTQEKYFNYYRRLPKSRQKKADNYINQEDKMRSVAAFILLIKLLDDSHINYLETDFRIDKNGKLYLMNSDVYLNLSHSGNYVIAAIADFPIGVDVERIDRNRNIKEIVRYVLDQKEIESFNQSKNPTDYFYSMWTRKESYIKCVGKGLSMGMNAINLVSLKDYRFKCFNKENHQFAICYAGKPVIKEQEIKL